MNKEVFRDISCGMYIVGSSDGIKLNSQIANSLIHESSDPTIMSVSINKENLTHDLIMNSRVFSISILSEDTTLEFIGWLGFKSGKNINKFDNLQFNMKYSIEEISGKSVPLIMDYCVSYMLLEVIDTRDLGTHTVFFGKVVDSKKLSNSDPMSYRYYHKIKGGLTQKRAPSYLE